MEMSQMTSNDVQSQLDIYLDEGCCVENDLDVLDIGSYINIDFLNLQL